MSKSIWKNKFNIIVSKKTKKRSTLVNRFFLNRIIHIHNGKKFVLTKLRNTRFIKMPLGSFSLTRQIGHIHIKKRKKKKKIKKK